jgi:hypothetical protein
VRWSPGHNSGEGTQCAAALRRCHFVAP